MTLKFCLERIHTQGFDDSRPAGIGNKKLSESSYQEEMDGL